VIREHLTRRLPERENAAVRLLPFRRKRPEPPIGEAEAYARSYGEKSADVKPVKLPPRRKRFDLAVSGEQLRRRFEERLAAREDAEE
jgi:hypothetical protein